MNVSEFLFLWAQNYRKELFISLILVTTGLLCKLFPVYTRLSENDISPIDKSFVNYNTIPIAAVFVILIFTYDR